MVQIKDTATRRTIEKIQNESLANLLNVTGSDIQIGNNYLVLVDPGTAQEILRIGLSAKNSAPIWATEMYTSNSRTGTNFIRTFINSGVPTITLNSGGNSSSAQLNGTSWEFPSIIVSTTITQNGNSGNIVTSLGSPSGSGLYVASSSGGSPTTQLNQRTITLADGSTIDVLVP